MNTSLPTLFLAVTLSVAAPAQSGPNTDYRLSLPPGFDAAIPRPVMIAWTKTELPAAITAAGFVVVRPHALDAARLPALLRQLRIHFRIEGSRFHLADTSAGGRDGLALVASLPFEFRSVILLGDEPLDHLEPGLDVAVVTTGDRPLVDRLAELRASAAPGDPLERAVAAALDDFHGAAAQADAGRYFARFAPEGVFLGTDPEERWTVAEFEAWSKFAFDRDSAWIFVPQRRNVTLGPNGDVAWFDEVLGSTHYGECRGTGVLRRIDGEWRVALYDLTVPIPNELLDEVVAKIRAH